MMPKKKLTQVLPSARRLANLKQYVTREWKDVITDLAMAAYRGPIPKDEEFEALEPFAVILAPIKIRNLDEEYVSAKHYKVALKEFRRITTNRGGSLRNKIHALVESIPPETQPPFAQMREKFCGLAENIEESDNAINAMEDLWKDFYSPAVVTCALKRWIELLDELHEEAGGRHAGADPITAEIEFVMGLAHYWKDELGNNPSRWGEDPYAESPINQDAGPFPNFVREAAKIIPSDYSPKSWDWAIRSALKQATDEELHDVPLEL